MLWVRHLIIAGVLAATVLTIFVGLPYSWSEWREELRRASGGTVRRAAISAALIAVTIEVGLLAVLFTPLTRSDAFLQITRLVDFSLLLIGIPCAFGWRGKARWWIRACALFLPFLLYGGLVLVSGDL